MASGKLTGGHLAVVVLLLGLNLGSAPLFLAPCAAQNNLTLDEEAMASIGQSIRTALVGPAESAFLQVLVDVRLRQNAENLSAYDIEVRYDPQRYRNPHTGTYPLSFEDQFITWGKRLALYSYGTLWRSGHFHLHNIADGQQAWIPLAVARRLLPPPNPLPRPNRTDPSGLSAEWRRLLYAVGPQTDTRSMALWFRLMRHQARPIEPLPARPLVPQTMEDAP